MLLEGFGGQLLLGVKTTIEVSVWVIFIGVLMGILAALGELSSHAWIRRVTFVLTSTLRGLPELLVLFAFYFGLASLLSSLGGSSVRINPFLTGVFALSLLFGAYASEVFRGAFLSIPQGQRQTAAALGLSRWVIFSKILLPQVWRHALPGLGNLMITSLKDSSLIALIGVSELTYQTQLAANQTQKPFTFYLACALIYLVLTLFMQTGLSYWHRRVIRHEH